MAKYTERQIKVLNLIAKGFTNEEISKKLKCTTSNIESFVFRLQFKLGAKNRANIVYEAIKQNVID